MTRSLRLLGLTAALAMPAVLTAQASSDKPVSFGVSGGLSLPVGDFGDGLSSGYAVAGHVFLKPAAVRALRFRGDLSYDRWDIEGTNASFRSVAGVANALFDISTDAKSMVKPYLLGGVGLFNGRASVSSRESDTNLGVQLGGGLTFQLSGFSTFLEAKYVNAFTEGDNSTWIPITFGVRF